MKENTPITPDDVYNLEKKWKKSNNAGDYAVYANAVKKLKQQQLKQ
jgi:hypothetical protein